MQAARSRHGKLEKSLLSFATHYPLWEPDAAAKAMLGALSLQHAQQGSPHFPYTAYAGQLQPSLASDPGEHPWALAHTPLSAPARPVASLAPATVPPGTRHQPKRPRTGSLP